VPVAPEPAVAKVAKARVGRPPKKSVTTNPWRELLKRPGRAIRTTRPLFTRFWVFAWVVIVILASQITLYEKPLAGVYVNAAAFASLIGLALWHPKSRELAISAAILPVATMISLSLPQTTLFAQTVVFYDAILILGLVYRFVFTLDQPLSSTRLNLRGYILAIPLMLVMGQALGALGYILLRHHYPFGDTPLPLVAGATAVFAISEEVLFRGLIQQRAAHTIHPAMAALLSAILYTSFTFGHSSTYLAPLFGALMGIVLAITYHRKQNLLLTIAINVSTKLAYIGLVAGFIFR
jgi:membrane protease YdiL (CAAX protease family)